MSRLQKMATVAALIAALQLVGGCSGMTTREKDTAIGAGAGAVGGALLTEGSGLGTVGGAVVGGVIGNQVVKGK